MKDTKYRIMQLAAFVKAAQDTEAETPARKKIVHKKDPLAGAFPDYSKSLATQFEDDPRKAGARRALTTGAVAAILGGLIGKLLSDKPGVVAGSALAGGTLGAIPGYVSGKREAESEKSRLLFLRRLGISRPGELEILLKHPELAKRVTSEGTVI